VRADRRVLRIALTWRCADVVAAPEISFAIPCYNERDNLGPLVDAIEREADRLGREYEIVITDDRSTDG